MQPVMRHDRAGGSLGRERADHGRAGLRQRSGRANAVCVSAARRRPMVTVNAGGLPEGVFESELFGHVKGAFTDAKADRVGRFELADGGTLFLDEIANVPMNCRPSCCACWKSANWSGWDLRRRDRVDVRVLSATNADLQAEEVAPGASAQDLLFRLNTIEIHMPPLRRAPRRHSAAGSHFLRQSCTAIPQATAGLRSGRYASAARASVARQRARAGSRGGARGAAGAGRHRCGRRFGLRGPQSAARGWKR